MLCPERCPFYTRFKCLPAVVLVAQHLHSHCRAADRWTLALQDTTTRVWDVRMTGRGSAAVLRGRIGAIRSLRYSPCGRVLAVAEPADFITLYDAREGYEQAQEVHLKD